jgi:hypothetical protein
MGNENFDIAAEAVDVMQPNFNEIGAYERKVSDTAFIHRARLSGIGKDLIDDEGNILKDVYIEISNWYGSPTKYKILQVTQYAISFLTPTGRSEVIHADSAMWESVVVKVISEEVYNTPLAPEAN